MGKDASGQGGSVGRGPREDGAALEVAAEIGGEVVGRGIAVGRIHGQCREGDRLEGLGHQGFDLPRQARLPEADRLAEPGVGIGDEWPLSTEQLEQDDAQGVDVGPGVDGPCRVEQLRGHVDGGPQAVAAVGGAARETEVQDPRPEGGIDQDVAGLQIAVLDPELVGALDGVGHVRQEPRLLPGLE